MSPLAKPVTVKTAGEPGAALVGLGAAIVSPREQVRVTEIDQGTATAEVRVVEPLGADTLIHLDTGGQRVIARVAGFPDFRPGDQVGVTLDQKHLHLFDAGGARLG